MVLPLGISLKTLRMARAFAKAIKTGNTEIIEKYLADAPNDVKQRIRNMVEAYNKWKAGEMSDKELVKVIASNLGIDMGDAEELIDTLRDFADLVGDVGSGGE